MNYGRYGKLTGGDEDDESGDGDAGTVMRQDEGELLSRMDGRRRVTTPRLMQAEQPQQADS